MKKRENWLSIILWNWKCLAHNNVSISKCFASCLSQVTIIIYLSVVGALLLYMLFLLLVDPLIRKHDPYTQPLHNEEDSEVTIQRHVCFFQLNVKSLNLFFVFVRFQEMRPQVDNSQAKGNTVLERVEGAQQRWKKQVQEQRKTVFDRHKMLS